MILLFLLLPVISLLLAALGIAILRQARRGIGYPWMISSLTALFALGMILFLRFRMPIDLPVAQWNTFGNPDTIPIFRLDAISWPYALSMAALLVSVIFTDAARLQKDATPLTWIFSLATAGLGLLAVMAASPLTLILTWTAIDLAEVAAVFDVRGTRQSNQPIVLAFAVRVSGTLLVWLALLLARSWNIDFSFDPIPQQLSIFMLLAVGLRLGVLPINLSFTREVYSWRGLGNMLRMLSPASGLVILGRMPVDAVPAPWKSLLLFLAALGAVYGAALWLGENPRLNARPYWVLSLAALAILCVIRGNPASSVIWGTSLILTGSVLFLYSAQSRAIWWIPFLGILILTGLPFTPTALGWLGLIQPQFDFNSFLSVLAISLLAWGYLRRMLAPQEELYTMERWVHTIYPLGLVTLLLAQVVIEISDWRVAFIPGAWWVSVPVGVFGVAITALFFRRQQKITVAAERTLEAERIRWMGVASQRLGAFLATIFQLDWAYRLLAWSYEGLRAIIQLLTTILEGQGGILWVLVMLALLLSLLKTNVSVP